ncbi:MAG: ABC transporter [Mycobacteriales bacterium]
MQASAADPPLVAALTALRERITALRLPLEVAGAADARREAAGIVGQIDDYLLPRLRQLDAPLLTVVGGSTGAGKSTLVNSLVGEQVTTAGVLRPTTRAPVLVCSPADRRWFADARILPGFARTTGAATDAKSLQLVTSTGVPTGLALLDAPDIDSVVATNRELAAQLLAAADLWLFVTTAARYADAVPWDLLHTARARSTALAIVLNRVPAEAVSDVSRHLAAMLRDNGLADAALFTVPEVALVDGELPAAQIAPVGKWLEALAADADGRAAVVRTTLGGALDSLRTRLPVLVAAVQRQRAAAETLRAQVSAAYGAAAKEIDTGVRGGSLLRGEVLARWQEFVGTGEFMRSLESKIGQLRDRVIAAITGRATPESQLRGAVESSVDFLVLDAADRAAERTVQAWQVEPAGKALLGDSAREISRSSSELRSRLGEEVRGWQGRVLQLVAAEGADKRLAARIASLGLNGAGLAVMIAVFSHTGGLSGGEIAIAGGTTVAGQRLLEAIFGDQAVRTLAAEARVDLMARVERLLGGEVARFDRLLEAVDPPEQVAGLRSALADLEAARGGRASGAP